MVFKLAVISDIHFGDGPDERRFGDALLLRAVQRVNGTIHPDAVAVLGDCLDQPDAPDLVVRLERIKEVLALLKLPMVVIPGNHDPSPKEFYSVMPEPPGHVDIGPVRLVPFVDPEEPGYNARRTEPDLDRLRGARSGHDGPIVALQHVPVLPPGTTECPYGYTNADAVMRAMRDAGVALAIGGHYHYGTDLIHHNGCGFLCVRAMCVSPFIFTVITIDGAVVLVDEHELGVP